MKNDRQRSGGPGVPACAEGAMEMGGGAVYAADVVGWKAAGGG